MDAVLWAQAAGLSADGIIGALSNLGGLGILAAVLFYLHTRSLKEHKEELAAERAAWGDRYDRLDKRIDDGFELIGREISEWRRARAIQSDPEYRDRTVAQEEELVRREGPQPRRPKG